MTTRTGDALRALAAAVDNGGARRDSTGSRRVNVTTGDADLKRLIVAGLNRAAPSEPWGFPPDQPRRDWSGTLLGLPVTVYGLPADWSPEVTR